MTENNDFNNTENEKRYKVNIDHHKTSRNYVNGILDCETNVLLDNHTAINNRLNEQHETIQVLKASNGEMEDYLARLEEENEQLKSELSEIKRQEQEVIEYLQTYHNGDVKELKMND